MPEIRRRIIVHGGAGSSIALADGCRSAAEAGTLALRSGHNALDSAVAAAVVMEDDGRFNAGTGSVLRLDGLTIQMDAAVMDSEGTLGAVAAVRSTRNPVLLARQVAKTPHVLLVAEGADALARRLALAPHPGPSEGSLARHRRLLDSLRKARGGEGLRWNIEEYRKYWNFDTSLDRAVDTIGVVAMSDGGYFAVAASTGGASPMLSGRVGDTPLAGCGFYAGPHGGVAATGIGEEIIRRVAAFQVYQELARGRSPQQACEFGVDMFPAQVSVGFIALGRHGHGIACNQEMAWHAVEE